jgi:hypothetical protein
MAQPSPQSDVSVPADIAQKTVDMAREFGAPIALEFDPGDQLGDAFLFALGWMQGRLMTLRSEAQHG